MSRDQAFPVTEDAKASDSGIRYRRRMIALWEKRAYQRAADRDDYSDYMFLAHERELYAEAIERRVATFQPDYFNRRVTLP